MKADGSVELLEQQETQSVEAMSSFETPSSVSASLNVIKMRKTITREEFNLNDATQNEGASRRGIVLPPSAKPRNTHNMNSVKAMNRKRQYDAIAGDCSPSPSTERICQQYVQWDCLQYNIGSQKGWMIAYIPTYICNRISQNKWSYCSQLTSHKQTVCFHWRLGATGYLVYYIGVRECRGMPAPGPMESGYRRLSWGSRRRWDWSIRWALSCGVIS